MGEKMKKQKITHSRIFKMWYRNLKSSMNRGRLYFEHVKCKRAIFSALEYFLGGRNNIHCISTDE